MSKSAIVGFDAPFLYSLYMRYVVITSPDFIPDEPTLICRLFDCGLDTLHLRKPDSAAEDCARLLDALPAALLPRIVIHDHFNLCRDYGLAGVHLNRRNPVAPSFAHTSDGFPTVSASCHSIAEAAERKATADYVFLSPIFDSISKQGYQSAYTDEMLRAAATDGLIDSRVVALGGVTIDKIPQLREWHFGGAAFLGDVWQHSGTAEFDRHARELGRALKK